MEDLLLIGATVLFFSLCMSLIRFFDLLSRSEQ